MATTGIEEVKALERKLQAAKKKQERDVVRIQVLIGEYFFGLNRGEVVIKKKKDPVANKILREIFLSLKSSKDKERFKIYFPDKFFEIKADESSHDPNVINLEKQEA